MKKGYVKPAVIGEKFLPNEYIAACGDSGVVYKFKCTAGEYGTSYHVYLNGADGVMGTSDDIDWSGRSGRVRSYSPCYNRYGSQGYHEADSESGFEKGYMYELNKFGENTGDPIEVIVWTDNGTNTHCTTDLDMSKWETAKS